jgi:mRNA interferase MazF
VTYDAFDVVVVPFPFTDRKASKRRPALVLSNARTFGNPAGHSVLAMITSQGGASWPLDVSIADQSDAGLPAPSLVRMKLFTLDHRLILKKAGKLSKRDRQEVVKSLKHLLPSLCDADP